MSFTTPAQTYLRQRLAEGYITSALLVDDAFDVPTVARVQGDLDTFWNFVERDDGFEELRALGIGAEAPGDFGDNDVAILWARRAEGSRIIEHANRELFDEAIVALQEVQQIADSLGALGLSVDTVGEQTSIQVSSGSLVFLDYYLGPTQDSSAVANAAVKARDIYKDMPETNAKPFIVLMSSRSNVADEADSFRDMSGLLGGLFDFVSKEDLTDPALLAIKLATWAADMPIRHKIQVFVEALSETMDDTTQDFIRKAKALTIEDYAYVQSLSLEDEGQSLGDYMQWLFSSLLANRVLEDNDLFVENKKVLNELSFQAPIPTQGPPSRHFAEIYSLAIAEPMSEDIDVHPRAKPVESVEDANNRSAVICLEEASSSDTKPSQNELPVLRLGDLLVKDDDQEVYMVATPDCDLLFAPGTKRRLSPQQSVVLIPGRLYPLKESKRSPSIQTQLFRYREEQWRIYWEPKNLFAVTVGNFWQWYRKNNCQRPARVRLPYALKIQQEVVTSLSRIGMPVPPPLHDFVTVEYYSEAREGGWEQFGEPVELGATVIYRDREKPAILINTDCVNELLNRLETLRRRYDDMLQSASSESRKRRLQTRLERLEQCRSEPENLMRILETAWELPQSGRKRALWQETIGLHRNGDFSRDCPDHELCLNIVYD